VTFGIPVEGAEERLVGEGKGEEWKADQDKEGEGTECIRKERVKGGPLLGMTGASEVCG